MLPVIIHSLSKVALMYFQKIYIVLKPSWRTWLENRRFYCLKTSYNEIDVAFKKLNITWHDINESIPSSDEILPFKPKILQAIKFIREKKKRPDLNSIYEHFSKSGASNISKNTMYSIISKLIKQKLLENKKSAYGDSFRIKAETDTKN